MYFLGEFLHKLAIPWKLAIEYLRTVEGRKNLGEEVAFMATAVLQRALPYAAGSGREETPDAAAAASYLKKEAITDGWFVGAAIDAQDVARSIGDGYVEVIRAEWQLMPRSLLVWPQFQEEILRRPFR